MRNVQSRKRNDCFWPRRRLKLELHKFEKLLEPEAGALPRSRASLPTLSPINELANAILEASRSRFICVVWGFPWIGKAIPLYHPTPFLWRDRYACVTIVPLYRSPARCLFHREKRLRGSASLARSGPGRPLGFLTPLACGPNFPMPRAKTSLFDNTCIIKTCPCRSPSTRPAFGIPPSRNNWTG